MKAHFPRFETIHELGSGATARVELARLTEPWGGLSAGSEVAVKTLKQELHDDERARSALRAEAEAGDQVRHPSLARVLDHGEGEAGPFLVLQYVPGRSLLEILIEDGILPEPLARSVGAQLAGALAALHGASLAHGDVKPENVRLDSDGQAVLLDLGFARRITETDRSAPGSLAYLSPERALGGPPDPAGDVFALGVVLYELATGVHPFAGHGERDLPLPHSEGGQAFRRAIEEADPEEVLAAIASARYEPPSSHAPQLSPFLDALLLDVLSRDPRRRPAAQELWERLTEGEAGTWWRSRIDPRSQGPGGGPTLRAKTHLTPLVGRERELEALAGSLERVREGRLGAAVWLTGPAGSGKWRLVSEFAARARMTASPPLYLYARWSPQTESLPAGALLALLFRWLQVPPGRPAGEREHRLLEGLLAPDDARSLCAALDPLPEEQSPGSIAVALCSWLEAISADVPLVVFLDDLHRAGEVTLGALSILVERLARMRVLLVLGLRGEVEGGHSATLETLAERIEAREAGDGGPLLTRMHLGPLDRDDVADLVGRLFHRSVPKLRLAHVLWERSRGNPGLISEILRDLLRRGTVRATRGEDSALALLIPPDELPLPPSLDKLIAERFADLEDDERRWLERLAVVGGRIAPDFLIRAFPPTSRAEIDSILPRLSRKGWLVPAASRYRFARPALREAVYRSLSPSRRKRLHVAAARGLAPEEGHESTREEMFQRTFHLRAAQAHREVLGLVLPLMRFLRHRASAQRMQVLSRWGLEAIDALPTTPELDLAQLELLEVAADAADRLGHRQEERELLDRLVALDIDHEEDPANAAYLYLLHGRYASGTGQLGLARGMLRNAVQLALRSGDAQITSASLRRLAISLAQIGDLHDARERARQAMDHGVNAAQRGLAHLALAMVDVLEDRVEDGLAEVDSCLAVIEKGDVFHLGVLGNAHMMRGRLLRSAGRPARAHAAARHAVRLAQNAGERRFEAEARARLGGLLVDLDRVDEAEIQLRDALLLSREIEDRRGETLSGLWLGILLWEQDDRSALASIVRATVDAREIGFYRAEAVGQAFQARVYRAKGRLPRSDAASARAAELLRQHGGELVDRVAILGTRALILDSLGRRSEGRTIIRELRARLRRENQRIRNPVLRRAQRTYSTRLLEAVLSPDGPVFPRFRATK